MAAPQQQTQQPIGHLLIAKGVIIATENSLDICRALDGRAPKQTAGLMMLVLRLTSALVMRLPGPAAPLPVREDELQGAADHGDRSRAAVDEGERLGCRLSRDHGSEHGVTCGRIGGIVAGELGEDERPGRVTFGPGQVQAAQAGRAPGQHEGADHPDGLLRGGGQVRHLVPGEGRRKVTAVAVGEDDQAGRRAERGRRGRRERIAPPWGRPAGPGPAGQHGGPGAAARAGARDRAHRESPGPAGARRGLWRSPGQRPPR